MNGVKNNKNQSNTIRTNIKKEEPYGTDTGATDPISSRGGCDRILNLSK